ncbi:GDSL lipase/acylhydrolase [Fomitiporia mediterranea MF3/22]|uniref:GDSL lipase/acylhydrolase n=1 Tax=Fomitiporia mediterranea (strain MF3/22) TaxID=694068 RepID=UPI00044077B0|nr:GDSL lipase/acylhydrolase [Fomitiporia mediterranea MF3/22]EJD06124.1 GDSL lipase/acylhydrolase [Fomitiporia mediterranea MF3/22]
MFSYYLVLLVVFLVSSVKAAATLKTSPRPNQFKNLVTFGDSYTDVGSPADNGSAWPTYAAAYGPFNLFPFAKSGATCSNNLTNRPAPSVMESQLPTYFTEVANGTLKLSPEETIYTLWIGTNDVGRAALLTGDQEPGVTLVDTVSCATRWVKILYESGARNFLFQNMIPLEKTVLYSKDSYINHYWTYQRNTTEWSLFMTELTTAGNALAKLMLQDYASSLHGAHIGLFDSHALFSDMISNPSQYLNGTAPPNVTIPIKSCAFQLNEDVNDTGNCTIVNGTDRDSYLWYDELHPSEQADRVVARELTNAVLRKSNDWVTWFS